MFGSGRGRQKPAAPSKWGSGSGQSLRRSQKVGQNGSMGPKKNRKANSASGAVVAFGHMVPAIGLHAIRQFPRLLGAERRDFLVNFFFPKSIQTQGGPLRVREGVPLRVREGGPLRVREGGPDRAPEKRMGFP